MKKLLLLGPALILLAGNAMASSSLFPVPRDANGSDTPETLNKKAIKEALEEYSVDQVGHMIEDDFQRCTSEAPMVAQRINRPELTVQILSACLNVKMWRWEALKERMR
jgi:hypothetical protein